MLRRLLVFCAVATAGFAAATAVAQSGSSNTAPAVAAVAASGVVVKVIDGDTLDVRLTSGKRDRIRVLGIDSPEMKPRERCATQATAEARRLAQGKSVRLTTDRTQALRDRHGRLLVYVTLPGGTDLGRRLLASGYATVYVFNKPFLRLPAYKAAQKAARSKSVGLWGDCSSTTLVPVFTPPPTKPTVPPPTTTTVPTTVVSAPPPTTTTGAPAPPTTTTTVGATTTTPSSTSCHASYPDFCITPPPPDKDCGDFSQKNFRVLHSVANPDPHRLDGDQDGRACES
jgi:endonuclease YncB( thermonuclease family)